MNASAVTGLETGMRRHPLAALTAVAVIPLVVLVLLVGRPATDARWENHVAHFWVVLATAAVSVAVGYAVSVAARRRRDARLFLASLAFISSAAFLGLHALATPGVLLGKNAGFELATPVGLVLAGAFAAASSLEYSAAASARVMRRSGLLLGALGGCVALWALVSLAELAPLDEPLPGGEVDGWQVALAVVGIVLYGAAAFGYWRLYLRRWAGVLLATTLAFVLLAEAMWVIAWARNWQLSWWERHLLMLAAFVSIGLSARSEWHEERFSALYLDQTLAGARDVSILFADLEGYTSFAERMPPTASAEMLRTYFDRLVPLLEDSGGDVHQVIGDALMVIYNKEGDLPDHALRAARAGLLLQDAPPRSRPRIRSGRASASA